MELLNNEEEKVIIYTNKKLNEDLIASNGKNSYIYKVSKDSIHKKEQRNLIKGICIINTVPDVFVGNSKSFIDICEKMGNKIDFTITPNVFSLFEKLKEINEKEEINLIIFPFGLSSSINSLEKMILSKQFNELKNPFKKTILLIRGYEHKKWPEEFNKNPFEIIQSENNNDTLELTWNLLSKCFL
jgi:hypothetical protein